MTTQNAQAKVIQFPSVSTTHYEDFAESNNTKRAYESDWKHFDQWCKSHYQVSLPSKSQTICDYISELADQGFKLSTIKRRLASIISIHSDSDYANPTNNKVEKIIKGIGSKNGTRQTPKKAIMLEDLKPIIDAIDTSTISGKRDKALILIGYGTMNRRSEIVAIDFKDINWETKGIYIYVKQKKTKKDVNKAIVYLKNKNYCPIVALTEWLKVSKITEGAVFRSINVQGTIGTRLTGESVANVVKKYAKLAGLDPSLYAGHSLRSGHATVAGEKKYNQSSIQKQGGWNTTVMVARYQHDGQMFENNTSSILELLED